MEQGQNMYESPAVHVLGSVYDLTQGNVVRRNKQGKLCVWNKTWGHPDFVLGIPVPIANCSS
jgi:hypothetical protein